MIDSNDLPNINSVDIQSLGNHSLRDAGIGMDVLRLDKIHTIVSGNKWFKLKYYIQDALRFQKKGIITFGGAYSNHIVAVAYACRAVGLRSIGIIRGEAPALYSPTLQEAQRYGMDLRFLSRAEYSNRTTNEKINQEYSDYLSVDEGGRGASGIKGAEEILHLSPVDDYSHLLCAVGTGTMMTGLINSALPGQIVIGIPILKLPDFPSSDISNYIAQNAAKADYTFETHFHFGGYAKRNGELIDFMNRFYQETNIATDWVYTGKLFYAAISLAKQGYFPPGSRILVIHSGGLQGNRSLPYGLLTFHS